MTHTLLAFLVGLSAWIDPMIGTDFTGHTFPGATYPFGMVQLSPDTRPKAGDWTGCSGYHYSDSTIYGFSHTHLSGTGCDDLCDILLTPGGQPSSFSHEREKASAGYYEVFLEGPQVLARLSVGRRVGMHEYHFPAGGEMVVGLDLKHRDVLLEGSIEVEGNVVSGHRKSSSWSRDQDVYYYIEFSSKVASYERGDGSVLLRFEPGAGAEGTGARAGKSANAKAGSEAAAGAERVLTARVAISSVSVENAKANLMSEYPRDFESLRAQTSAAWEEYLHRFPLPRRLDRHKAAPLKIDPTIYYTALYHCAIHPSLLSDSNGEYRGMDRRVHKTEGWDRYTIFSLWDTFRGLHPLLTEAMPELTADFMRSFISIYEQAGKLPVWELWGWETDCMIGYNAAPVIADVVAHDYVERGLLSRGEVETLFQAMLASARNGQYGLDSFRANGLVLADDEHESVSKTLEYAYDDWCVAQVAAYLGHDAEYQEFMRSSQYWRNVFDPAVGFVRGRLNGRWVTPFNPREVNNHFTEANSWQYSFFVPHDIPGMIEAYGGPEKFKAALDALFSAEQATTGRTQVDITGLIGQYAHGNEPSHHVAFLYDYIGKPEKTDAIVRRIMSELYTSAPDGLCGNDDCGQMSAWYVLAAQRKYPVCPGSGIRAEEDAEAKAGVGARAGAGVGARAGAGVGAALMPSPKFERIVTNPVFVVENDIFKDSAVVTIANIQDGAKAFWRVASSAAAGADTEAGTNAGVKASTMAGVGAKDGGAEASTIWREYDGSPIIVHESSTLEAYCEAGPQPGAEAGIARSFTTTCRLSKIQQDKVISLGAQYSRQYTAGGPEGLIDGQRGKLAWRTGGWQGYQDTDFVATIDLLEIKDIHTIGAGFLQDARSWIWSPVDVSFEVSCDGTNYTPVATLSTPIAAQDYTIQTWNAQVELTDPSSATSQTRTVTDQSDATDQVGSTTSQSSATDQVGVTCQARYVRVRATNFGIIPDWHPGVGCPAFIFIDEIWVR